MNRPGPADTHPAARMYAAEYRAGQMDRREFLTRATSLGLSVGAACAMAGLTRPAVAQSEAAPGGTLRIQMDVLEQKDPRVWDFSQLANVCRGHLEYLVQYNTDGSITPMLLDSWEVSEDATEYLLRIRGGVTWTNGDAFTAEDVARNFRRWCDGTVTGNSMATRMGSLVDPATRKARPDAITVVDDMTVRLSLATPDISLIAGVSDYPAAVMHGSYDGGDPTEAVGTGPFRITEYVVGDRAVLERTTDHTWWGEDVFGPVQLDRIEFLDFGTDPATWLDAFRNDEIDMLYESVGTFIEVFDDLGLVKSETLTAATITIRGNQNAEVEGQRIYADRNVRRALQLACDNAILLELGYSDRGEVAANHHVSPIHPEYADIGPSEVNTDEAFRLMDEAGLADFEHELISIDDDWRRNTADAVAAQLRDAGLQVRRRLLPGSTYWSGWTDFPFSTTNWNQRPLGVQVYSLAYRSGEAWNETGFANDEFDRLLADSLAIADADERRALMERMETLLRDEGVVIQPYWRALYRHYTDRVVGAEMHPTHEMHLYRYALRS